MAAALAKLELEGFDELNKTFNALDEKLKKKPLRKALRAGAKVFQVRIKQNASAYDDSGRNAKFIKVKSLKRSRTSIGAMVTTGTRDQLQIPRLKKAGYYPFTLEYGAHRKGIKATRYMSRAFTSENQKAIRVIAMTLGKEIENLFR